MRDRFDLFIASVLVLFLELACIRWFPAHVLFLTFFTNVMLLAAFLGISIGCLAASRSRNYLPWTPLLLVIALSVAQLIEWQRQRTGSAIDVGNHVSPQLVFFGVESQPWDPSKFVIPIEAVSGALFVLVALTLVGPGQQLGRALGRITNRIESYTINIGGSLAGIILFTMCARWELGPVWWFAAVLTMVAYFIVPGRAPRASMAVALASAAAIVALTSFDFGRTAEQRNSSDEYWSPYYRIHYARDARFITVNLIGHQQMSSRHWPFPAYALPHLLNRDSKEPPFAQVLVIGAGSGNDVSRALEWRAQRVDAVEIDPVIYRLGKRDHPDQPYDDRRTIVHLDDGRNYLRSSNKQYDLIVYALVDSLVLHSSYSNIRLESYLFTTEAFADIKRRLAPGGLFVMYNYFRQGWIVARLHAMLEATFGPDNPIVFNLPSRDVVKPDDVLFNEFTMMLAGDTAPLKQAFVRQPQYWLPANRASDQLTPDGFSMSHAAARDEWTSSQKAEAAVEWMQFSPTTVVRPAEALRLPTDAWPFLYLRGPMIPELSVRGMLVMGVAAAVLLLPFLRSQVRLAGPRDPSASTTTVSSAGFLSRMFFLGAGFMLIETKAVVQMALLFGSTWNVNAIVFCAVLTMILLANLFVMLFKPKSVGPFYGGLFLSLAVSALVPLDAFLGWSRELQIAGSCLLAFTPVLFAGVIFAISFRGAADADRAFGANVAGAMVGGLSEYSSMLLGFQYVVLVAIAFYACSALSARRESSRPVPV